MIWTLALYGAFCAGMILGWLLCALMIVASDADRACRDERCE